MAMENNDSMPRADIYLSLEPLENHIEALEIPSTMDLAYIEDSGYFSISQHSSVFNQTYGPQSMPGQPSQDPDSPPSPREISHFLAEMGYGPVPPNPDLASIHAEDIHSSLVDDPMSAFSVRSENRDYSPLLSSGDSSEPEDRDHYSHAHANNLQSPVTKSHPKPSCCKEPKLPKSVEIESYFFCDADSCTRRYRRLRNLRAHQKRAHGEEFMCLDEDKPKPIQDATTDGNRKYYTCAVAGCSKIFTEIRNLWAHQDKYHSSDAFFCKWKFCTERCTGFVTLDTFLQHVAKKHHNKRYVCEVCHQYGSDRKDHMDLHSRRLHPEIELRKGTSGRVSKGKAKEVVKRRIRKV